MTTVLFRNYGIGQHYMSQPLSGGDIKKLRTWKHDMTATCQQGKVEQV